MSEFLDSVGHAVEPVAGEDLHETAVRAGGETRIDRELGNVGNAVQRRETVGTARAEDLDRKSVV